MKNSSHRAVSQRFTAIAVVLAALSEDASTKARSIDTTLPVTFEANREQPTRSLKYISQILEG